MAVGPEAGLGALAELAASGALAGHHLLPAAQADLCRRCGRVREAERHYREAIELAPTDPERRFRQRRLAALGT